MKILFWNIDTGFDNVKKKLIKAAIEDIDPDVFCVAEGTKSHLDCDNIVKLFNSKLYRTAYYIPTMYTNTLYGLDYKWNECGLKIFLKDKNLIGNAFSSGMQRLQGRIVALNLVVKKRKVCVIFLHNKAKKGTRESTDEQRRFIDKVNEMIEIGKIAQNADQLLMIGDFNIEPWDNILRDNYLDTHFLNKHYAISKRSKKGDRIYFNPCAENIISHKMTNLGGTYYSKLYGWAMYDYVLFDDDESDVKYKVVTSIDKYKLIDSSNSLTSDFLAHGIDHLPILITLK